MRKSNLIRFAACGLVGTAAGLASGNGGLIISEVVDATLPSGLPKWVELTNTSSVTIDLSNFSIGNFNNGGTTLGGGASTVLSGMLAAGDSYVISYENGDSAGVGTFFDTYGFDPDNFDLGAFFNGDDVIVLFDGPATGDGSDATIVDVYGVIGTDGTGEAWEYTDGYAYRLSGVGQSSSTFVPGEWFFSGANGLETGEDVEELALIQTLTTPGTHTSGAASASNIMVNGSGATLLESFLESNAITNDFLDLNAGCELIPEQLAPTGLSGRWVHTYRVVGSGNGFAELRDWGNRFATAADGDGAPALCTLTCSFSDRSFINRIDYCLDEAVLGGGDVANPGGFPGRSDADTLAYMAGSGSAPDGIRIDYATLDVPVSWFTINSAGSPLFNRVPGAPGYGDNPRVAINADGTSTSQSNRLRDLEQCDSTTAGNGQLLNTNTANPDELTIFDTPLTLTPIAPVTNYGVGKVEINMSDLRFLAATGRTTAGENLMVITRDSGSGTRNGFMNGICLDPSWGVGENIGSRTTSSSNDLAGPDFQPSNKGGSSRMEGTVQNARLATGHTGAERGEGRGWLTDVPPRADIPAVISDLKGGTTPARPSLQNVLDGSIEGFNIIGPASIATLGDPRSAPAVYGGKGWQEPYEDLNGNCCYDAGIDTFIDLNGNGVRDGVEAREDLNPAMRNNEAAAFVNNITRSVFAFQEAPPPTTPLTEFSPGEFLASRFSPVAAATFAPQSNPPANADCNLPIMNPEFSASVQMAVATTPISQSGNVLQLPAYKSYNTATAGIAPVRTNGVDYGDGGFNAMTGDSVYMTQGGAIVVEGSALPNRNKVAGDFNGDGFRNIDDCADMIAAWDERNGSGTTWVAPDATQETFNDADGSGTFEPREEPFDDVDGDGVFTFGTDFFSVFSQDLNGNGSWDPAETFTDANGNGLFDGGPGSDAIIEALGDFNADGRFDAVDVRYFADGLALDATTGTLDRAAGFTCVDASFGGNFFGTTLVTGTYADGDSRADVANAGVSAGAFNVARGFTPLGHDGTVDIHDINYVKANFGDWSDLATAVSIDLSCDMNGDLVVDAADIADIVEGVLDSTIGDIDLDGDVDGDDLATATANQGIMNPGYGDGDVDCDGDVDGDDLAIISGDEACPCDFTGEGDVDVLDLLAFLALWFDLDSGADFNTDTEIDVLDLLDFLSCWFPASTGTCE